MARGLFGAALLGLALLLVGSGEALAQGCAMCRESLGGVDDPLSQGIRKSILFLIAVPFALFAGVGGWLVYSLNRVPAVDGGEPGEL